MDTSLVASIKKSIPNPNGTYKAFEVGYNGRDAGIKLDFVKAAESPFGWGVRHTKYGDESYRVSTTSQSFNLKSLETKLTTNLSDADSAVLTDGLALLKDFIERNGSVNPVYDMDLETSPA